MSKRRPWFHPKARARRRQKVVKNLKSKNPKMIFQKERKKQFYLRGEIKRRARRYI
jgi:hypothetical protein